MKMVMKKGFLTIAAETPAENDLLFTLSRPVKHRATKVAKNGYKPWQRKKKSVAMKKAWITRKSRYGGSGIKRLTHEAAK